MRLLLRLVGLIVVMAVLAIGLILMLPGERIARIAADQISKQTGRDVTLSGEARITLYPILGVSAERFTVANADWSDSGPMFEAQDFKIGVEPQALWGGEVRITGLEATAPQIRLERAADGRVNWELGVSGVAPSGQSGETGTAAQSRRLSLTLDRALITGGSIAYTDHASAQTTAISGLDLDLRWPDFDGTATFEASMLPLRTLDRKLVPASERIHLTGTLDQVSGFIDGQISAAQLDLKAPGGAVTFAGHVSSAGQAKGNLAVGIDTIPRFLAAFGMPAPQMPDGVGNAAELTGFLTRGESGTLSLRESTLALGGNRFTGGADFTLSGTKPKARVQLRTDALDLSGFAGSDDNASGTTDGGVASTGWSTTPIDASALGLLDGEFALVAQSVKLGDLTLGKTRTKATLTRSRLVFEIAELRMYDGLITGQFVINNRSGLSVGGDLLAKKLNLQTLLSDSVGISRLTGKARGRLQFLGVGQNMDAIMKSLSGKGRIKTGRGVIEGFDLDRLMRAGNLTGGTTVFDKLSANFTMKDGQLLNDNLALELPKARADGAGRIGLGARDIDYLFTPKLLEGENRRGLAIPVRITGPWSNPRILPDLEKAIDLNLQKEKEELKQRLEEEADKLEVKAEQELEKALEKELGVTVEEGQSIEDALKETLEDEAAKELLKLFE